MIKEEQLQRIIAVLRPLAEQLPKGLRADWRGTNHYELQAPNDEAGGYWWLDWFDCLDPKIINEETEEGQRAGLLLDLAEAVSKLKDEGLLQIEPTNVLR